MPSSIYPRHEFPWSLMINASGAPSGGVSGGNISSGIGSPASTLIGWVGDIYLRRDGGANTTLYVKESGNGTTSGWVAK